MHFQQGDEFYTNLHHIFEVFFDFFWVEQPLPYPNSLLYLLWHRYRIRDQRADNLHPPHSSNPQPS